MDPLRDASFGDTSAPRRSAQVRRVFPYIELAVALLVGGMWYLQGGAVWYAGAWPGPWPLILLAGVWAVRVVALRLPVRPSAFDIGLWAFVAAAGIGVWAAYDRGPAWAKFWLIVASGGIYYAIAHQPDRQHIYVVLAFIALFGTAVTLYFLATNDWAAMKAKVPVLVSLGERLSSWLPSLSGHRMHPNVVGGILATVLPSSIVLIALPRRDRRSGFRGTARRMIRRFGIVTLATAGLGVGLSLSRGAWIATAAAASLWAVLAGLGRLARRHNSGSSPAQRARTAAAAGIAVVALALAGVAALLVLSNRLPGLELATGRIHLQSESLVLARDYLFTGAGLGMFPIQYSLYALLIHVFHTIHSHNLILNILIEQGVLGLAAYLLMAATCVFVALRRLRHASPGRAVITEAGVASLAIVIVHGLVDDPLYGARAILLLFIPFAIIMAGAGSHVYAKEAVPRRHRWVLALAVTAALAALFAIAIRPISGSWYANFGALAQAKVELTAYDPDHWNDPTIDEVRQQEDLSEAQRLFETAIAIDPKNRTARQRLAAIALARGEYADALNHMNSAWDAGHRDSVTRLLLGDALVAAGQTERAADVVRGLPWAKPRLLAQAWYRYRAAGDYRRAADAWAAVLLLDPDDEQVAQWQAEAERLIESGRE